ncbi:MAG: pyruvate dehydrogenase complex dihydrolipoamide acetyltransferase [Verrucomicrobia bacterium]|nr:pyruvate dehydrogenase complex dihydrolipoamide acetyltransferase [Verrucomicrobiota bacterium]
MPIAIEMPKLSDTMTEGTLVKWIKKVGDTVAVGDVLAEVETDKATMEMEAFDEGILSEIYVNDGEKVEIGQRLALLVGRDEKPASAKTKAPPAGPGAEQPSAKPKDAPATAAAETKTQTPGSDAETSSAEELDATGDTAEAPGGRRIKASPLARKIAAEMGVDLTRLQGSGPAGRIIKDDVVAAGKTTVAKKPATVSPAPVTPPPVTAAGAEKRIPLSGMRKTIAARLLQSKTTIPHFYLQAEIDAEPLTTLRQQINAATEAAGLGKLTVNDFILKATAMAALRVPLANAAFDGDSIIQFPTVQLACAVAVEEGLVTPVIREAEKKTIGQISTEVKDLAARARSKKLKPEEYQGGTITVSNLGAYGVEQFFAIINPPQAVIVSVGTILKKPVINAAGEVVPGQRIILGISCDHRVVDGAVGAQFLSELKKLLETPALMLI